MDNLYLIATIADQPVAIRAALVESVVDVGVISPVPLAPPHVAGLAALRSRVLTMICCERALGLPPGRRLTRAVVIEIDNHSYGLLVSSIEDARIIEEPPVPLRTRLDGGWSQVALGMLRFQGESLLLVDPVRIVAGVDLLAA